MRLRIREHRGLNGAVVVEGHNMKLGQGGIREIEFFTQTRQLIAGGRDVSLRDRSTLGGLAALAAQGWVPPAVATELSDLYLSHRELEHRIQMVNDEQTQMLPVDDRSFESLARFAGFADSASFDAPRTSSSAPATRPIRPPRKSRMFISGFRWAGWRARRAWSVFL